MNDALNKKLNAYYREIADNILCPKNKKTAFLRELKREIGDFVENSPEADMTEIIAVFGSPEEIAQGFSADITGTEIKKRLSLKKTVILFLLAVLLIWAIFAVISFIDVHTESHGYFTEEIMYIYNVWGKGI